jgi:phosphoribosylamine--glycine ligase
MLTSDGPQVLEFNVRLGDPEAEVLLPRLRTDFIELAERAIRGELGGFELQWDPRHAVTVVAASEGYPGSYPTGREISGIEAIADPDVKVYHAGTRRDADGRLVTSGGRVLAVTALGRDRGEARTQAYGALKAIRFDGMHHRGDIAREGRSPGPEGR